MHGLTDEQVKALEGMVTRRCKNTGETREVAAKAIARVLTELAEGRLVLDVVDDDGVVTGVRDAHGYHPNQNDPARRGRG